MIRRAGHERSYGLSRVHSGEYDMLFTPREWVPDASVKGLVFCHAAGSLGITFQSYHPELYLLANAGIPIVSADMGGTDTWMNDTVCGSSGRIYEAWQSLVTRLGVNASQMLLYGASMGGGNALEYARRNPSTAAAVATIKSVIDADDIHDNNRGANAAGINAAYGSSAAWEAAKDTHNPAPNAADYASKGIPTLQFYSENDPICRPEFATAFRDAAGTTLVSVGSDFHSFPVAGLDRYQLLDFFQTHA